MRRLRSIAQGVRASWWKATHENFLIVFNWHQVCPDFDPLRHQRNTWTRLDAFRENVTYLSRHFQIVQLHEAMRRMRKGNLRGRCVALTFDDGDISVAEYVVPFLRSVDQPATFFINTAYLSAKRSYWFPILSFLSATNSHSPEFTPELRRQAEQLRRTTDRAFYDAIRNRVERLATLVPDLETRLVSEEWLSSLDGEQFALGAHGHEHQRFSMMSAEWQRQDLRRNLAQLSEFRAYRPIFAVPFGRPGDWTEETIGIAHEFALDVVLANGGINLRHGRFLRRIPADGGVIRRTLAAAMSHAE